MATVDEVFTVLYSGDLRADALMHEFANWNYLTPAGTRPADTLYFSFAIDAGTTSSAPDHSPLAFNAAQQNAVRGILEYAGQVTGIHFVETASAALADFHFANADLDGSNTLGLTASSWSYEQSGNVVTTFSAEAYVFLDDADWRADNLTPVAGTSSYETLLHEVGHALGLDHPFDGPFTLPADQDNTNNTVMSYQRQGGPKSVFQPYDLLALYWIYGGDGLGGSKGYNSVTGPTLDGAGLINPGIRAVGTEGLDSLIGSSGNDTLIGLGGNDFFLGAGGNDSIDGGAGIDRASYEGDRSAFVLNHTASGWTVRDKSGLEGTDTLVGVERLQFGDLNVAIDIDGHAGQVARILGALFGKAFLQRTDYVGVGLQLLDAGTSYPDLVALAVSTDQFLRLAGSRSNHDFVELVYQNVVGSAPGAADLNFFVGSLDNGTYSQASLALLACNTDLTTQLIDLPGLYSNGLPYLPL